MTDKHFLAFDLGATSGRSILGSLSGGKLSMKELTRFPNAPIRIGEHYYWNIFSIYEHLLTGLKAAAREGVTISSVGIDTWGVDFAFLGADGSLLGLPYAYRDPHTDGAPEEFFDKVMPRSRVYELTGIQVMNFNSLYQLYILNRNNSSQLAAAKYILFMPDALSYLLTGNMATEYTIASTSQLLNPHTRQLSEELLGCLGVSTELFPQMVMPGQQVGLLKADIARECGVPQLPIIAVAGHDTASAVASVPALDKRFAYLSSGTWSLMGIEVAEPVISERTAQLNITNEGGVEGTTRLLKNITGMWILEQCISEWRTHGKDYPYTQIICLAQDSDSHSYIDPDHSSFANPASMLHAIAEYCKNTNQTAPQSDAEYIRIIFESLALKYRYVLEMFRELAPFAIERLHIIGGGSQNELLNQMTADSTGIEVIAGPKEATAIGNIMLQARADGMVSSLRQMRQMIAQAIETKTYIPKNQETWGVKYAKFLTITIQ